MRDCHVTWEGLFREAEWGRNWGNGLGINADYTAHCEIEPGDSLLGFVTESVKILSEYSRHFMLLCMSISSLDIFKYVIPALK